ncbi:MAG: NAD(P)H-hydrate epimerase [Candidatus Omnitrophica bacterium]|nr:NAD(P)H-hydrate epimerase [Candidatus Omnitrophota bacterium]
MSEIDRKAQDEFGLNQIVLMENAGRCAFDVISSDNPSIKKERIAIFCGKGNNGGDGFVLARYLANGGARGLFVFVTGMDSIKKGAALDNYNILRKMGLAILPLEDFLKPVKERDNFTIFVDAVFGTGFQSELPRDVALTWIHLNSLNAKVYAIDVPSGLDATSGRAAKNCIKAYKTVTFGLPKIGFYLNDGPSVCGEVIVKDIGFPEQLLRPYLM